MNTELIIKIQKCFRGWSLRLKQLPLIMYQIQKYLKLQAFQCSTQNEDGRINSCFDEEEVINEIEVEEVVLEQPEESILQYTDKDGNTFESIEFHNAAVEHSLTPTEEVIAGSLSLQ